MSRRVAPVSKSRTPPRPARRPARWADPRVYLTAVAGLAVLGLVVLPLLGDGATALAGARSTGGCRVLRVVDGDTVTLWCPGEGAGRVRLTGYDAPEVFSPSCPGEMARGLAATWALRALLLRGGTLEVRREGRDRYGRGLAALSVDGTAVASRMIAGGHGRAYDGGARAGWCG
jgi:endonuclease YncB( thermonuclease family)